VSSSRSTRLRRSVDQSDRRSMVAGRCAASTLTKTVTASSLFEFP
jgi:hypothetical protein